MVEHTSANPNGPIHIGNFRGSIIGDVYARLLKAVGAEVITNFYVDDLGHQIPVVVIGYELLKKHGIKQPKNVKIDHYLGQIYGITHTCYDIQKMKQDLLRNYGIALGGNEYWLEKKELINLTKSEKAISKEKYQEFKKQFDFLLSVQTDIYKRFKNLYDNIKKLLIQDNIDLPKEIPNLNRKYMEQNKAAVKKVRTTTEDVLRGQKEELALLGIEHDFFDWEADFEWSGEVADALVKLEKNGFLIKDGKARLFDANKAADLKGAREYLNLKPNYEIPKGILVTSEGDSLYLLRDIPYSIKKSDFYKTTKVYNVIGKPQELTQRHLNLALRAIGREDVANKQWHLNYEYMELKGALTRMSARRLQYITPLDLYEQTKAAVFDNFLDQRNYPQKEKDEIAHVVAVGAIKYSIIAVGIMRKMSFNPSEVVSLNNNTSPFVQYAYARSQNILAKAQYKKPPSDDESFKSLGNDEEWNLILELLKLPSILESAVKQIKPELICNYLFDLANTFNRFYDEHRVLDAESKELIKARIALTYATGQVLSSGLTLLGIESTKRM
jgi:arginyl-tRNA synthetase